MKFVIIILFLLCSFMNCLSHKNIIISKNKIRNDNKIDVPKSNIVDISSELRFKEKKNKNKNIIFNKPLLPRTIQQNKISKQSVLSKPYISNIHLKKIYLFRKTITKMKTILRSVFILLRHLEKYKSLIHTNKKYHDKYNEIQVKFFSFKQKNSSQLNFESQLYSIKEKLKNAIQNLMPFSKYFKNLNSNDNYFSSIVNKSNFESDLEILFEIKAELEDILTNIHNLLSYLKNDLNTFRSEDQNHQNIYENHNNVLNQQNVSDYEKKFDELENENGKEDVKDSHHEILKEKLEDFKTNNNFEEDNLMFDNNLKDFFKNDKNIVNKDIKKSENYDVKIGLPQSNENANVINKNKNDFEFTNSLNNEQLIEDEDDFYTDETEKEYAELIDSINKHIKKSRKNSNENDLNKNDIRKKRKHILGDNKDSGNSQDAAKLERINKNNEDSKEIIEYEKLNEEIKDVTVKSSSNNNQVVKNRLSATPISSANENIYGINNNLPKASIQTLENNVTNNNNGNQQSLFNNNINLQGLQGQIQNTNNGQIISQNQVLTNNFDNTIKNIPNTNNNQLTQSNLLINTNQQVSLNLFKANSK